MKQIRQYAAMVLAAALTCSAAFSMTGCKSNPAPKAEEEAYESVYTPEVPENPINEDIPGREQTAKIGETVNFDNKLTVTLDRAIEIDDVNKVEYRVILCEMTVVNNTDKKIDCQTLTHFKMKIDGELTVNPVRDVSAAVVARKYYSKIGSDLKSFNQEVKPGETVQGYVYIYAPTKWDEMKLIYTPYRYYSNDTIEFDLPEEQLTHYSEKIG
ncbi:MAG: DUF5067 domain-containing protein [Oscillospiraceae bacterium]|nr:DUF5067 domain-containing protein [Oscillospiraceae bacterium]